MKRKRLATILAIIVFVLLAATLISYMFAQPLMLGMQPVTFVEATTIKEEVDGKPGFTRYTTKPGDVIGYETTFIQMPIATFFDNPRGSVVEESYTTSVYEDGKTYQKQCLVYLPYGYDPSDTETKYNVIYFQHGNNGYPGYLTREVNLKQFDYLFASGDVEPVIIVFVSYYMDDTKTVAGDGNGTLPANYYLEIANDVIPAIEMKYNTYLKDTAGTMADIEKTREHRAFSGYSRGGCCTWYMFRYNLKYFKYFAPMSCNSFGYEAGSLPSVIADDLAYIALMQNDPAADPHQKVYEFLMDGIEENTDKDFFVFVSSGHKNDGGSLREQMDYLTRQTDTFHYGTDQQAGHNIYFSLSEFPHSDDYVPFFYYNCLPVFWG